MIALVDYGAGNLTSVKKALTALKFDYRVPVSPGDLSLALGIIVPGVGHFAATSALTVPWHDAIERAVTQGTPLLGICVGMQWLFEGSDESPDASGFGAIAGRCVRLRGDRTRRLKVPHVGWNALTITEHGRTSRLLAGLPSGAYVYFTHSFARPVGPECAASTTHVDAFASVVEKGNVFGVQFHPEKSSEAGLCILRNFLQVCEAGSRTPQASAC